MVINSVDKIKAAYSLIDDMSFDLNEDSVDSMSLEDLEKFIHKYDEDYNKAISLLNKIQGFLNNKNVLGVGKDNELKKCNDYISNIQMLYKENRKILSLSHQVKKTNKKLENSLGLQFGIFSAVLSVLSFVLNNSKLLSYNEIKFKNVLLINLSHILACAVMFYFAMWFIKPYKHNKGRVWTLTLIIIAICALIYLIAKNIITL